MADVKRLKVAMALAAFDAAWHAAEDLLGEAARRAPIEEGTLRASGAITAIVNGRRVEGEGSKAGAEALIRALLAAGRTVTFDVEVSFNTVYAARQHEETGWRHPRGGQAKYLEHPLLERAARYELLVAKAVEAASIRASL